MCNCTLKEGGEETDGDGRPCHRKHPVLDISLWKFIASEEKDAQLSSMARFCASSLRFLSTVENFYTRIYIGISIGKTTSEQLCE
jgi:hypothetical protein